MFLVTVVSPFSLGDGVAMLSLLCRFLVVICFSIACSEFQVGIVAPEEFRWKSSPARISIHLVLRFMCYLHEKLFVIHC